MGKSNEESVMKLYGQKWFWESLDKKRSDPPFYTIHPSLLDAEQFKAENVRRWDEWCLKHTQKPHDKSIRSILGKDIPVGVVEEVPHCERLLSEMKEANTNNTFKARYLTVSEEEFIKLFGS